MSENMLDVTVDAKDSNVYGEAVDNLVRRYEDLRKREHESKYLLDEHRDESIKAANLYELAREDYNSTKLKNEHELSKIRFDTNLKSSVSIRAKAKKQSLEREVAVKKQRMQAAEQRLKRSKRDFKMARDNHSNLRGLVCDTKALLDVMRKSLMDMNIVIDEDSEFNPECDTGLYI